MYVKVQDYVYIDSRKCYCDQSTNNNGRKNAWKWNSTTTQYHWMVSESFRSADRVKGWKQPFKREPNRLQSKLSGLKRKKRFFRIQEEECHPWITQNLYPRKTPSIMSVLEQMVKTTFWKVTQGLIEDWSCWVYDEHNEPVEHLVSTCIVLSSKSNLA